MAAYCVRCGYRCNLLKSLPLQGNTLCDDCLKELGFPVNIKTKERFLSMGTTYEMLLAEARLSNPNVLESTPGQRSGDDYQPTSPISNVRTFNQILDDEYLVSDPGIKLDRFEKCYYKGSLSINYKSTVVKGGGGYSGVSLNLGFGLRYSIGGKNPVKTKEVNNSIPITFYLTSKKIIFKNKKGIVEYPYEFIDNISWGIKSFDVSSGGETITISTKLLPVDNIKRIYNLITLKREEDIIAREAPAKVEKPKSNQRSKNKTSSQKEKDPIELIREYKKLLDEGIITQEEYEQKKKDLLKL